MMSVESGDQNDPWEEKPALQRSGGEEPKWGGKKMFESSFIIFLNPSLSFLKDVWAVERKQHIQTHAEKKLALRVDNLQRITFFFH